MPLNEGSSELQASDFMSFGSRHCSNSSHFLWHSKDVVQNTRLYRGCNISTLTLAVPGDWGWSNTPRAAPSQESLQCASPSRMRWGGLWSVLYLCFSFVDSQLISYAKCFENLSKSVTNWADCQTIDLYLPSPVQHSDMPQPILIITGSIAKQIPEVMTEVMQL